ncbi:hypothetical protein L195_g061695, partial [Trifolium pratense]
SQIMQIQQKLSLYWSTLKEAEENEVKINEDDDVTVDSTIFQLRMGFLKDVTLLIKEVIAAHSYVIEIKFLLKEILELMTKKLV